MPVYNVTDPQSGKSMKLTGDSPPTEQELIQIFSTVGKGPTEKPQGQGSMGQRIARSVAPYARPALEYGGMMAGGAAGAASGLLTGPGAAVTSPAGAVVGAGLGYAGGRNLANRLDEYAGTRQPESLKTNFLSTGKDVVSGAGMEATGQTLGPALTTGANMLSKAPFMKPVNAFIDKGANKAANWLYESAMKIPPASVPAEIRDKAIRTGIEGGYPVTKKGLIKLSDHIKSLNHTIRDTVEDMTQTKTVATGYGLPKEQFMPKVEPHPNGGFVVREAPNKIIESHGAPRIYRSEEEAKKVADFLSSKITKETPRPETKDVGIIDMKDVVSRIDKLKEFYDRLPPGVAKEFTEPLSKLQKQFMTQKYVTPVEAQEMKQLLYKLNQKHYGELMTSGKGYMIEGNKAIARGLKEELVKQNPQLATLNAKDSALINLDEVLERAVNRSRNYDVIRLGDTIMAGVGGAVGGVPGAEAGYLLKRVIEAPAVKSKLAIALGKAGKARTAVTPGPLKTRAAAYATERQDDNPPQPKWKELGADE